MGKVLNNMKKIMNLDEKMIKGFAIETTNPETGEVEWWSLKNGKKFTCKTVMVILQELGWNMGELLFLEEEGKLTKIYTDSLDCEIAVISTNLAKSFHYLPYASFIKSR